VTVADAVSPGAGAPSLRRTRIDNTLAAVRAMSWAEFSSAIEAAYRRQGYGVSAVSGTAAGESLPLYVRDHSAASLHKLGVKVLPYMRLYGSDADSVYLQHVSGGEAVVIEKVDALVLCTGHTPVDELSDTIEDLAIDIRIIGDAASPRTAEEAVYEGLSVAAEI
jgi:hypothetical protein